MSSILLDVQKWAKRAEEARELALIITDPETKQQMLTVAKGYDRISELAKEQAQFREHYELSESPSP